MVSFLLDRSHDKIIDVIDVIDSVALIEKKYPLFNLRRLCIKKQIKTEINRDKQIKT